MRTRRVAWTAIGIVLATGGALLQTSAQPPQRAVTTMVPAGATLVLQAKDFATLVAAWNTSAEKSKWLTSHNYEVFSRSRLFLRLEKASEEFSAAAGVPADMALASDVAGTESALALYDIGKLEFLYITRLPSARLMENALWRTRGTYEPREAAGTPFYVRVDAESERVVAFGVRDDYLVLATREDLAAGALTRIAGTAEPSVATESWFTQSIKAAGAPGDLRLVLNLAMLVKQPHFRSYWVQENVTELGQYSSAVSDLTRTSTDVREERVLLRAQERPAPANAVGLGGMLHLVPPTAALYRAWTAPSAADAGTLLFEKVIATSRGAAKRDETAPTLGATATVAGYRGDLETRIDEEPRAARQRTYDMAALEKLLASEPLTAMLHVEATRPVTDGVFIDRGAVIVLTRSTGWPAGAARDAVRTLVDPVWTKGHLGLRWLDARIRSQAFSRLEGLETVAVAERGPMLFVANDPELLVTVLEAAARPQPSVQQPVEGAYAAGFRHAVERGRFASVMRLIDNAFGAPENREPLFFSDNLVSLSETLARVQSASIVVRDRGTTVSETVTYQLGK